MMLFVVVNDTDVNSNFEFRMCIIVLEKFLQLEGKDLESTERSEDSDDERFGITNDDLMKSFICSRQNAYSSVVLLMLEHILSFTAEQFSAHQHWIVSKLAKLVLTDDHAVRRIVSSILSKFVVAKFSHSEM